MKKILILSASPRKKGNSDILFSAVSGEDAPVEKSARKAIPHMDCNCYIAKNFSAALQISYDPEFISEEKIRDVLDRAVELSEKIAYIVMKKDS